MGYDRLVHLLSKRSARQKSHGLLIIEVKPLDEMLRKKVDLGVKFVTRSVLRVDSHLFTPGGYSGRPLRFERLQIHYQACPLKYAKQ